MRRFLMLSIVLIVTGVSSGCGSAQDSDDSRRTAAEKQQALRESSFGPMVESMDRARSVELLQQGRTGGIDAAIEQSEGE